MARKSKADSSMGRLYEVSNTTGPKGLAAATGLSVAGVGYWNRKGISRRAAEKLQAEQGWSADYIMNGKGPALIGESANVDVEVTKRPRPNGKAHSDEAFHTEREQWAEGLIEAMELANELGMSPDKRYSTRVGYYEALAGLIANAREK